MAIINGYAPRRAISKESSPWKIVMLGPAGLAGLVLCLGLIRSGVVSPVVAFGVLTFGVIVLGLANSRYIFLATIIFLPFDVLYVPELPLNMQLVVVIAIAGLIIGFIRKPSVSIMPAGHLFLAYLAVLAVSIVQSHVFSALEPPQLLSEQLGWRASTYRGWYQLLAIAMGMAIAYFIVRNITSAVRLRNAVLTLLSISAAVALFSLYEVAAKLTHQPLVYFSFNDSNYVSQSRYAISGMTLPRAYGSAGEPLSFGSFLLVPLSLSAALILHGKKLGKLRPLLYGTLVTVSLAILLTFSTSAWFGAILSFCFLLAVLSRSRPFFRILMLVAVLAVTFVFLFSTQMPQTVQSISDLQRKKVQASLGADTRDFRYIGWTRSLGVAARFPILGVGLGNEPFWTESSNLTIGSYNILLLHLVEVGAVGLAIFSYLIFKLMRLFYLAHRRTRDPEHSAISLGCAAALLGCLGSHMAWGGRLSTWEWFVVGLGLATSKIIGRELRAVRENRAMEARCERNAVVGSGNRRLAPSKA